MDRRLGLACVLLADPHTLVLDDPAGGLSTRESAWLHDMLRAHAGQGGTVLFTTTDPKEAARTSDHVVTLEQGRLVADQEVAEFSRTRLRPRVAVRSPHAARLAALLAKQARTSRRSVEVVREGGNRLSVYGGTCADVGEIAFRHGIVVHQLADEIGDMGPGAGFPRTGGPGDRSLAASGRVTEMHRTAHAPRPAEAASSLDPSRPFVSDATAHTAGSRSPLEPGSLSGARGQGAPEQGAPQQGARERAAPEQGASEQTAPDQGAEPSPTSADPAVVVSAEPRPTLEPLSGTCAPEPGTDEPSPASGHPHPAAELQEVLDTSSTSQSSNGPLAETAPIPPRTLLPTGARTARTLDALPPLPPPISVRPAPSPLRPLRYEIRRAAGIGTGFLTGAVVLAVSAVTAVVLARIGHTPQPRLLAAWPRELPLPPAALGAGLLGALAFGDEFRHPALAADRGTVPRRLGLLAAKLLVSSATALVLAVLTVGCDAEVLYLVYGRELAQVPADWLPMSANWIGLVVGCAWAGVLAAGVFRSTTAGLAAVAAVPLLVVPVVHQLVNGPSVRTAAGLPMRLREALLPRWPFGGERYLEAALEVISQPVGGALTLSLTALLCAYLLTGLRSRFR
jgi:hypothetical protein